MFLTIFFHCLIFAGSETCASLQLPTFAPISTAPVSTDAKVSTASVSHCEYYGRINGKWRVCKAQIQKGEIFCSQHAQLFTKLNFICNNEEPVYDLGEIFKKSKQPFF